MEFTLRTVLLAANADEGADIICAFCFMTSAGVRMAHDTSSAREEDIAWVTGVGRAVVERRDLMDS